MTQLYIKDIKSISKSKTHKGYDITFIDGRIINLHKRRTIPALLTLIKYGEGCESDLTNTTSNLSELKEELKGKIIPENIIRDTYSDANKPFSELWNEEGFTFITNPIGEKRRGSKKYVLRFEDHDKLFEIVKKAERTPPNNQLKIDIIGRQLGRCNLCGSLVKSQKEIEKYTFSKDRQIIEWDHRVPVEKEGDSSKDNYQALCHYCNKSKRQICYICEGDSTDCQSCALAFKEKTTIVFPTQENIADRIKA